MHLNELKNAVDDGKTAKHQRWRTILHWKVKKELGFYARQGEGYTNEAGLQVVQPETSFYPTWDLLVESFSGYYADSPAWFVTNDPLEDYLPPERKTILDKQTPFLP